MRTRSRLAVLCAGLFFGIGAHAQAVLVDVVEFYNASLDHYFISASRADIDALDSGKFAGWSRTGQGFKAYDAPADGTSPVCRFYIPPAVGDSHFYSASPAECADVAAKFPNFVYESPNVMQVGLPDAATGSCRAGWKPVYRMWNTRADSNHRYTTDTSVRDAMLAKGYVAEGYGPAGVAMCAASAAPTYELTLTAASVLLLPGETRDVYATVTPRNGFGGAVALNVSGLPAGVAAQVSPAAVTVGTGVVSVVLRLTAAASASATAAGEVTVSASDGGGNDIRAAFSLGVATTGDPVAVRLSAIAAVEERARQLSGQGVSGLPLVQAVAAFMATRPEYKAAGVDLETVSAWGRFTDGRMHVVADNREPSPQASAALPGALTVKSGAEVPKEDRARLLHSFGTNFEGQAPVEEMRGYLQGKDWTVRPGLEGRASLFTLKTTSGDGFFYINTHGARIAVEDANEPESKIYAIQSSTLVDDDSEKAFAGDLASLRIVHFTARNGEKIKILGIPTGLDDFDTRYGITYRFVDAYMSFTGNSVVLINACFSGANGKFIDAVLNKGAGVYLGWTASLSGSAAFQSAPYFVDRMLGANQHADKESPPQRAFPYDLVMQDMAKKGLIIDKVTGGRLVATPGPSLRYPPIFAPSIRYVQVDEDNEKLTLVGEFGADPGKVTVGGTALAHETWSAEKIVAPLPQNGPGSSGDVVVEVRGVKSNARQLTEWSIPLKYEWINAGGKTGWKIEGSGTVRLRADVGGHRVVPGEVPKYIPRGGPLTKDSSVKLTGSGAATSGGCTEKLEGTSTHDRQGGEGTGVGLVSRFVIAGDTKKGGLGLLMSVPAARIMVTRTGSSTSCSGSYAFPSTFGKLDGVLSLPGDQSDNPEPMMFFGLEFTLDANYAIPPKTKSSADAGGTLTVSWTAATVKTPPRNTDDAGK